MIRKVFWSVLDEISLWLYRSGGGEISFSSDKKVYLCKSWTSSSRRHDELNIFILFSLFSSFNKTANINLQNLNELLVQRQAALTVYTLVTMETHRSGNVVERVGFPRRVTFHLFILPLLVKSDEYEWSTLSLYWHSLHAESVWQPPARRRAPPPASWILMSGQPWCRGGIRMSDRRPLLTGPRLHKTALIHT